METTHAHTCFPSREFEYFVNNQGIYIFILRLIGMCLRAQI